MADGNTEKIKHLVHEKRVMTIAVISHNIPWSSPVYFVFHDNAFYFFSNENSRHIINAMGETITAASIFHDSDTIDDIFGFQMKGKIEKITNLPLNIRIIRKYIEKFSFLKKIFGTQIIENKNFFLEKFKSHLFCFSPLEVYLSDNSQKDNKRKTIDLKKIDLS